MRFLFSVRKTEKKRIRKTCPWIGCANNNNMNVQAGFFTKVAVGTATSKGTGNISLPRESKML